MYFVLNIIIIMVGSHINHMYSSLFAEAYTEHRMIIIDLCPSEPCHSPISRLEGAKIR